MTEPPYSLLIENTNLLLFGNGGAHVEEHQCIGVSEDRIVYLGPRTEGRASTVVDGTDMLATPGLINAHCHAHFTTLARGVTDDKRGLHNSMLHNLILPLENLIPSVASPKQLAPLLELALIEMLKSGSTTIVETSAHYPDVVIRAAQKLGMRIAVNLTYSSCEGMPRDVGGHVEYTPAKNPLAGLERNVDLFETFDDRGRGMVSVCLGPHAPALSTLR